MMVYESGTKKRTLTDEQFKHMKKTQRFESGLAQRLVIDYMMRNAKHKANIEKLVAARKASTAEKMQLPREFYEAYKEATEKVVKEFAKIPSIMSLIYKAKTEKTTWEE